MNGQTSAILVNRNQTKIVNEYDQEISQSQTSDNPKLVLEIHKSIRHMKFGNKLL